jgi:hypothetical protein
MITVADLNLTPAAFRAAKLTPVPREVVVRDIHDHIGDPAIEAILVFPDRTAESELSWTHLRRLFSWVRQQLSSNDPSGRFVYTRVCRSKDLQEVL